MIGDYLLSFMEWLLEVFLWVPRKVWAETLDALAGVLEAIPVPDFVATADGAFSAIPANVLFFAQYFALGEGIAMIISAYTLRFLIRRIPIIG
jgi:hypothetical protein